MEWCLHSVIFGVNSFQERKTPLSAIYEAQKTYKANQKVGCKLCYFAANNKKSNKNDCEENECGGNQ